jgi:hypothetical protein
VNDTPRETDLKNIWPMIKSEGSNSKHKTDIKTGSDTRTIGAAAILAVQALPDAGLPVLHQAQVEDPAEGVNSHRLDGTGKCLSTPAREAPAIKIYEIQTRHPSARKNAASAA